MVAAHTCNPYTSDAESKAEAGGEAQRLRQEEHHKFKVSLKYRVSPFLKD